VKLVYQEISDWLANAGDYEWVIWITAIPICLGAAALLLYITLKPFIEKRAAEREARLPHGTAVTLDITKALNYNRIAIAIDFSSIDSLSIRSAIAQGGANARYVLLHVVETAGAMVYGSEIQDQETAEDISALENYCDQLKQKGYFVETKIGYGNPKNVLPKMVKEFQGDLLVMGAHGHNLWKDLIFGTTVDTVRHKVNIPVLIVRY
jgi:manganese transport protein